MIQRSVLMATACAAAIASGASSAVDAPLKPDVVEMKDQMVAVTSVQVPAGHVGLVMHDCGQRFPEMQADMTQAAGDWHARNGGWEQAASALLLSLRERMVARRMVDDVAAFDRTYQGILDAQIDRMKAQFESMVSDEDRKAGCLRFREAIDDGRLDVETLWPDALPNLRPFLK